MNLSSQIKILRTRDGLSQEALAERIYVSRQTVSNWETGKSYPDVHNLLMLSVLFDVSLDELVKGDIKMMKNELDVYKMKAWSYITVGLIIAAVVIVWPLYGAYDLLGLIPSGILFALAIAASIAVERIKSKHNLVTYTEIVAFFEGKPLEEGKTPWSRRHPEMSTLLKIFGGAVFGLALVLVCYFVWGGLGK